MDYSFDQRTDDFSTAPWDYPGKPPEYSGLLRDGRYSRMQPKPRRRLGPSVVERPDGRWESLNYALLKANVAAVDRRHVVVAVGSNASPAVMHRKFSKEGVDTTIPFVKAVVTGLTVGHSAHVSIPGYIAATPILDPSGRTGVFVSLLDDEQLACLDRTEPNYDRRLVRSDSCQIELEGRERPEQFLLYVSKRGVLAIEGRPVPSQGQEQLYDVLRRDCPPFDSLVGAVGFEAAMKRFGADADLREEAREIFKRSAAKSGFEGHEDGQASARYGSMPSTWPPPQPPEPVPDPKVLAARRICAPTADNLDRKGEQCVVLHPDDATELKVGSHVALQAASGPRLPPIPARLIRNESQPRGVAAVDQVLRNAIGVEVQESLTITPVDVPTTRLTDALLSRPHFFMVRVQAADLSIVEQRIGLLDPLALGILGIQSGDEVVIQGAPGADGKVAELRICVHAIPPETASRREHLAGGGATARFPSASDMLAVYPDLPWLFLDAASRASLGVDSKLSVVRVRASRRFQLIREFRELLLVLVLATVGVATVVESTPVLAILLITVAAAAVAVARSRLKRRLESP